jgi:YHS domain-containing protein
MKYLERFFRYVFWVVVTAVIAWIVKKAFQRAAGPQNVNVRGHVQANGPMQRQKVLVRDPVCGTYVAEDISYSLMQGGENLHFCSQNCMKHYQEANRLAAGA